jgi:hypothetical protein
MHVPTEEELAAIAVAYLAVQRAQQPLPAPARSRWLRPTWREASRAR